MNIENVNGIIIYNEEGIPHEFGINKMEPIGQLTEENHHDFAFKKEIVPSQWFKQKSYPYDYEKSLGNQAMDMISKGFILILNVSSVNAKKVKNYVYTIQVPIELKEESKKYLTSIYSHLKELIETQEALFFGEPYDNNGDYVWADAAYTLDDFYERLDIPKIEERKQK